MAPRPDYPALGHRDPLDTTSRDPATPLDAIYPPASTVRSRIVARLGWGRFERKRAWYDPLSRDATLAALQ
ncbi:MAG: hypothetical protein C0511_04005 [Hyphomicrobium sp.]|nr:hypothetical protein [Hyphomicrobium sp.]